jgi:oxygen-independent coproporphyrinogen III oxidase
MPKPRGIYIHWPFCLAKCAYCDFVSHPPVSEDEPGRYLDALLAEIDLRAAGRADTVYFGGGTPSLCAPQHIKQILDRLRSRVELSPDAEITLEANPATADREKLAGFRRAGINRLSLGVQSTSDFWLRRLGRIHSASQARALVKAAGHAGFANVSCDLIYGLPEQTLADFQQDLDTLLSWSPEHVSVYALSVEPDTLLARRLAAGEFLEPDDDTAADMYEWARDYLSKHGFLQYELSNFARPGKACRHNLGYWTEGTYLGFGVGAHSYERGLRAWNPADLQAYLDRLARGQNPREGAEKLKKNKKIAEILIMGLRKTNGVRLADFNRRFGAGWAKSFQAAFHSMVQAGLLRQQQKTLQLTPRGMLLANVVFRSLL